jgi:hypothetical protein
MVAKPPPAMSTTALRTISKGTFMFRTSAAAEPPKPSPVAALYKVVRDTRKPTGRAKFSAAMKSPGGGTGALRTERG